MECYQPLLQIATHKRSHSCPTSVWQPAVILTVIQLVATDLTHAQRNYPPDAAIFLNSLWTDITHKQIFLCN